MWLTLKNQWLTYKCVSFGPGPLVLARDLEWVTSPWPLGPFIIARAAVRAYLCPCLVTSVRPVTAVSGVFLSLRGGHTGYANYHQSATLRTPLQLEG